MTSPNQTADAPDLLPVSISAEGLKTVTGIPGAVPGAIPGVPEDGSQLPILQQESYQMQASLAAKLGFPIASMSTDDKLIVMLYGVTRHADVVDNGHTYRYGAAIRVLLEIYSEELDGDLTLPVVAAKAQLGAVSASAQLLVYGYVGDLAQELPSWQSFDVNSYADYLKAVSAVQRQVFRDTAKIRPVLLSSTLAWALRPPGAGEPRAGHRDLQALIGRLHPRSSQPIAKPHDRDGSVKPSPTR